jgi:hypothetical protein
MGWQRARLKAVEIIAFILAITAIVPGCQKSSSWSKSSNQGVDVTVIHPDAPTKSESNGEGSPTKQYWKWVNSWAGEKPGRVEVVIDTLRLQVDGQDYGMLKAGDQVTVDAIKGGKVTVNDQDRQADARNK